MTAWLLLACRPPVDEDRQGPNDDATRTTAESAAPVPTTPQVTTPPLDAPRVICQPARPLASFGGPYAQLFGEMEAVGPDLLVSGGGSLVVEIGNRPGEVRTSLELGCGVDVGNDYVARMTTDADIVWTRVLRSCWTTQLKDVAAGPEGDVYLATDLSGPATLENEHGVAHEALPYE